MSTEANLKWINIFPFSPWIASFELFLGFSQRHKSCFGSLVSCLHSACHTSVMNCADHWFPNLFFLFIFTPQKTSRNVNESSTSPQKYEQQSFLTQVKHNFTWTLLPPAVFQRKLREVICQIWGHFPTKNKNTTTVFYWNRTLHLRTNLKKKHWWWFVSPLKIRRFYPLG